MNARRFQGKAARLFQGWLKGWYLNDAERAEVDAWLAVRQSVREYVEAKSGRGRPKPEPKKRGRPRQYASNKERQRAYRERRKGKALRKYAHGTSRTTDTKPA